MSVFKHITRTSLLIIFIFLVQNVTFSQFGQNKVQYVVFDWKFMQSKHFDIYFAQGGESIARFTADAAESSLVSLQNNIGYTIKSRIPIIVFNSHNKFQQNNAIDEYMPEGVGGVTELLKNRVLVPFEGDYSNFRHVIHHELLHAYMNDMYYGGSLQNIISQNIRLQIPTWFSEGMAEYQSLNGNNKENDMFMRDAVIYDYMPDVNNLYGYLSYRGGQSFFSWLADEYGQEKIGDLMQQIKALGDVDEGFQDVYKESLDKLSEKWTKYLKQTYWPDISSRQEITDFAKRITNSRHGDGFYNTAPKLSPDGKRIVYISNRDDYFDVYVADVKSGRIIKKIVEGNSTADFEELHLLAPGLCWSPNGRKIAIAVKSGSNDVIYIIDVESDDSYALPIKFEGIFSVNWNPANNTIVFRGDNSKQSDIYTYDLTTRKLEQITNDIFSDVGPTWSSDGKKIYFTSDRGDYTDLKNLPVSPNATEIDYAEKDLYVYDMNSRELSRLSRTKNSVEYNVLSSPDGRRILFISDRNGINNIWMRELETGFEKPITNSISPISFMSLSEDGRRLAFTALNKGGYDIFYIDSPFDVDLNLAELPPTNFVQSKFSEKKATSNDSSISAVNKDSVSSATDTLLSQDNQEDHEKNLIVQNKQDSLNVYGNNIVLNLRSNPPADTTLSISAGKKSKSLSIDKNPEFNIKGNVNNDGSLKINKYKIKFSPDIIYSNASYSSFYGVQGIIQMAFSDVLGNHRIYAATSFVLDLQNSDYAFAYYYLPKRIDYGIEAYHSARFLLIGDYYAANQLYRYEQYGGNISLSYPISKFNRLDGALSVARLTKENMDNPLEPVEAINFAMPIVSYVHDNTLFGFTSPIKGTRYNLTMMGTPKIGSQGINFLSIIGDYRKYFELYKDYNFVFRLNAGASMGKDPQKFYIGGTENWINYETRTSQLPVTDIEDFAFSTPVLPLRGYDYDQRHGSKFVLMNAEFRFPLFRYLVFGPLPFAFQNIQGVAFLDVGTAWSNNKTLQFFQDYKGSFATKDLLVGMGFGTRIFLLYFPLKFDVAWSYNMQGFSRPKYYISIGSDF